MESVGKIYGNEETAGLFGDVKIKFETTVNELKSLLQQADKYLMFRFYGDQCYILKEKRIMLSGEKDKINDDDVFNIYSKDKIDEILSYGKEGTVYIEQRPEYLTITCGDKTLEKSWPCPPYCD